MAINPIPPLKNDPIEGFEEDFDPNSDAVKVRGIVIDNDTSNDSTVVVSRDSSNNLTFQDGVVSGVKTLTDLLAAGSGITEPQHEALDTLAHWIAEDSYDILTYSGNKVTNVTTWDSPAMLLKIRESQISYIGNKVSQSIEIQYDGAGVEIYRVTDVFAYSGNNIVNVTRTRV